MTQEKITRNKADGEMEAKVVYGVGKRWLEEEKIEEKEHRRLKQSCKVYPLFWKKFKNIFNKQH